MSERLTDEQIEKLESYCLEGGDFNSDVVQWLISDHRHYKKLAEERGKALEWASRIIDSGMCGMYGGSLRYDPYDWFKQYHKVKEQQS